MLPAWHELEMIAECQRVLSYHLAGNAAISAEKIRAYLRVTALSNDAEPFWQGVRICRWNRRAHTLAVCHLLSAPMLHDRLRRLACRCCILRMCEAAQSCKANESRDT